MERVRPPPGSHIPIIPEVPPVQYDEDDGKAMSGIWSEDGNPSVQESPRGTDYSIHIQLCFDQNLSNSLAT